MSEPGRAWQDYQDAQEREAMSLDFRHRMERFCPRELTQDDLKAIQKAKEDLNAVQDMRPHDPQSQ